LAVAVSLDFLLKLGTPGVVPHSCPSVIAKLTLALLRKRFPELKPNQKDSI
jgi:hypothetical protein